MSDSPVETSIAPWLPVGDGARAVDYYQKALGAVEVYRLDGDGGKLVVAQLKVDGAAFWVQEDGQSTSRSRGAGAVRIILTVNDPDAVFARAIAAGATAVFPVGEQHGWRTGRVTDPFGHDWEFTKPVEARNP